ncbi:MAG: hypothetical protein U0235_14470 [Polyangiaceae bacterium]
MFSSSSHQFKILDMQQQHRPRRRRGLPAVAAAFAFALTNTFSRGARPEHALQFVVLALLVLVGAFAVGLQRPDAPSPRAPRSASCSRFRVSSGTRGTILDRHLRAARVEHRPHRGGAQHAPPRDVHWPALYLGKSEPRIARDARIALFAALVRRRQATYHVTAPMIDVTVHQAGVGQRCSAPILSRRRR